jgi:triosephosphate isomerase (TIM)
MRKKLFAANWKMNLGPKEASSFCKEFLKLVSPDASKDWVLFPAAIALTTVAENLKGSTVKFGGQNCYFEEKGAFTGETSPGMFRECGASYILVGHSERRQIFGETDQSCAKKIKLIIDNGLIPMLCVGETQEERDKDQTQAVLERQLTEGLKLWNKSTPMTIAYEPVWAIGTGKVATPAMAEQAHVEIRKILAKIVGGANRAAEIQILYGGSVKPDNSREMIGLPNIDGFLVGGASMVPKSFAQIGQIPL